MDELNAKNHMARRISPAFAAGAALAVVGQTLPHAPLWRQAGSGGLARSRCAVPFPENAGNRGSYGFDRHIADQGNRPIRYRAAHEACRASEGTADAAAMTWAGSRNRALKAARVAIAAIPALP